MVYSVGNSIRAIQKNGLDKSFFLLGNDFFMQKIFIQNLKDKFSDLYEIEYFYFNESLDVDAFFNNINSMYFYVVKGRCCPGERKGPSSFHAG